MVTVLPTCRYPTGRLVFRYLLDRMSTRLCAGCATIFRDVFLNFTNDTRVRLAANRSGAQLRQYLDQEIGRHDTGRHHSQSPMTYWDGCWP